MANQTKITFNLSGLENLQKQAGDQYRARVGILGGDASALHDKTKLTNYEIGVIQLFGSITNKIPPRDFLFSPIQMHSREMVQDMGKSSVKAAMAEQNYKKVYALLGAAGLKWVLGAFDTAGFGQWAPNAEITIYGGWMKNKVTGQPFYVKGKGSASPLINNGQLKRAQTSDVVNKSSIG